MWKPMFYVLPLALSTLAIRVPVDGKDENVTELAVADKKQDTFYVSDGAVIDSYLIPPDPHRPAEVLPDVIVTPATYLLPPSPEKQIDYYAPTEAGEQTDWYPIQSEVPVHSTANVFLPPQQPDVIPVFLQNNQTYEVIKKPRGGKAFKLFHAPSRQLEPPVEYSPNKFLIAESSDEAAIPSSEINQSFSVPSTDNKKTQIPVRKPFRRNPKKNIVRLKAAEPTLVLHLTPPKPQSQHYKNPTKLYPKKVSQGFQPVPIPVSEFGEASAPDVPRAKPVKPFKPVPSDETEYFTPTDEKKIYLYQQAEQKRKLRGENEAKVHQPAAVAEDTYGANAAVPTEQETSETIYRHPGRNIYPAPLRQAPPRPPLVPKKNAPPPPAPGERTEFRMHGMKGPHSYQFGFDTGKGKNRQFRYEERDDGGRVKGHYGYMDKSGKMRVVNYNADPETGFHAEAPSEEPSV